MPDTPIQRARKRRRTIAGIATSRRWVGFALLLCLCAASFTAWQLGRPPRTIAWYAAERFVDQPIVRVRLLGGASSVTIDAPSDLILHSVQNPGDSARLPAPIIIEAEPEHWVCRGGAGEIRIPRPPSPATNSRVRILEDALTVIPASGPMMEVEGTPIAGTLRLHGDGHAGTSIDAVEHIALEAYLPGVLAGELYGHWEEEAFRAQAIAARSYALHEIRRRAERLSHFDLYADVRSQSYRGVTDLERAHRAVYGTAGIVLTWRGELLRAYYSASCGGRPASAADIWPAGGDWAFNAAAPLQAKSRDVWDENAPHHRWTVVRDRDSLATRLRSYGNTVGLDVRSIDGLRSIEIDSRNAAGRPVHYRITDSRDKHFRITADHLRQALNHTGGAASSLPARLRARSGDVEFLVEGSRVTIRGRGSGHGVGLCQYSAQAMALKGWSAGEMLAVFYPGAGLEQLYGEPEELKGQTLSHRANNSD